MERVAVNDAPVPAGARVPAGLATACALPFAAWWTSVGAGLDGGLVMGTLFTLLPRLATRARDFRWACRLFAGLLLAASVVGVLLGWFLLVPPALVLLAAGARSGLRPECLSTVLGGAVAFLTLAGFGTMLFEQVVAPHFREPAAFTATADGAPAGRRPGTRRRPDRDPSAGPRRDRRLLPRGGRQAGGVDDRPVLPGHPARRTRHPARADRRPSPHPRREAVQPVGRRLRLTGPTRDGSGRAGLQPSTAAVHGAGAEITSDHGAGHRASGAGAPLTAAGPTRRGA